MGDVSTPHGSAIQSFQWLSLDLDKTKIEIGFCVHTTIAPPHAVHLVDPQVLDHEEN